jgi:endonuclease-3 related protein
MRIKRISRHTLLAVYHLLFGRFGPQEWWPAKTPFEVCVGTILTQNASWGNAAKAISNLRRKGALNLTRLLETPEDELAELIKPSGYFRLKARRLKHLLVFLSESGAKGWRETLMATSVDEARKKLLGVHGVGPETADSILLYAADMPSFVVDKYTLRIGARCGWFGHATKYETARAWFSDRLPREAKLYNEFHALIVRLGADFCKTKPLCADCPIKSVCKHGMPRR